VPILCGALMVGGAYLLAVDDTARFSLVPWLLVLACLLLHLLGHSGHGNHGHGGRRRDPPGGDT